MSLTTVVNTTRTALSADPRQANATFEANSRLVGPTEVAVKVGSGHSFAVDARGGIIAMAGTAPGLVVAEFDLAAIRAARIEEAFRIRSSR